MNGLTLTTQVDDVQFVVFSINNQLFSLLIDEVVEILRVPFITMVPGTSYIIEGVINLRGSIIPVVSLHKRFNLKAPPPHKKNRIVIVQGKNEKIGLMVEEVKMVTYFNESHIEPVSGQMLDEEMFKSYIKHEGQVIGVLNLEQVLYKKAE